LEPVHAAGVVLDHGNDLLVAGGVGAERLEADAAGPISERKPWAAMTVERNGILEGVRTRHRLIKGGGGKKVRA
jgi:hypothetical protein